MDMFTFETLRWFLELYKSKGEGFRIKVKDTETKFITSSRLGTKQFNKIKCDIQTSREAACLHVKHFFSEMEAPLEDWCLFPDIEDGYFFLLPATAQSVLSLDPAPQKPDDDFPMGSNPAIRGVISHLVSNQVKTLQDHAETRPI